MQRDAEAHAEEDRRKREEIDARNEADGAVYRSEKMLRDNAGKISEADRRTIEDAVSAVKNAMQGGDPAAIKSATDRLNQAWQAVSANLYRAASEQRGRRPEQGQPSPEGPGPERKEEEVVDAEVVNEGQSRAA